MKPAVARKAAQWILLYSMLTLTVYQSLNLLIIICPLLRINAKFTKLYTKMSTYPVWMCFQTVNTHSSRPYFYIIVKFPLVPHLSSNQWRRGALWMRLQPVTMGGFNVYKCVCSSLILSEQFCHPSSCIVYSYFKKRMGPNCSKALDQNLKIHQLLFRIRIIKDKQD